MVLGHCGWFIGVNRQLWVTFGFLMVAMGDSWLLWNFSGC